MKKIYKIFGAAAIIGLFLLSSLASTSLGASRMQAVRPTQLVKASYELDRMQPVRQTRLVKASYELMTDEQEIEAGIEPSMAIFFPDLIPWSCTVETRIYGKYLVVGIKNDGRSILWCNFNTHAEIHKIGNNVHKDIACAGALWFRGQIKYFRVKVPATLSGCHDVEIDVDDKDQIFEGLGEINNHERFDNVYFGID